MSELFGRRFAEFVGVPYQNYLRRREWEELWETEAKSDTIGAAGDTGDAPRRQHARAQSAFSNNICQERTRAPGNWLLVCRQVNRSS
jgi:hypothetical protein